MLKTIFQSLLAFAALAVTVAAALTAESHHALSANTPEARIDILEAELDRAVRILDLSMRYALDPAIVILVDSHARDVYGIGPREMWTNVSSAEILERRMLGIIAIESRGLSDAVGDNGKACGLTQIWVTTADAYSPGITCQDLLDPATHVSIAFAHFLDLLEKNDGEDLLAMIAWNYGQRGMLDVIAGRRRLNEYADRVLRAGLN